MNQVEHRMSEEVAQERKRVIEILTMHRDWINDRAWPRLINAIENGTDPKHLLPEREES